MTALTPLTKWIGIEHFTHHMHLFELNYDTIHTVSSIVLWFLLFYVIPSKLCAFSNEIHIHIHIKATDNPRTFLVRIWMIAWTAFFSLSLRTVTFNAVPTLEKKKSNALVVIDLTQFLATVFYVVYGFLTSQTVDWLITVSWTINLSPCIILIAIFFYYYYAPLYHQNIGL